MSRGKKLEVQLFGGTIGPHRTPPYTPGKPVGSWRLTPRKRPLSGVQKQ